MKSMKETLKEIIANIKSESENPVDELLGMGFTPCQLVHEFGMDVNAVKSSELYKEIKDMYNEDLDTFVYPFDLDKFNRFDAQLISRFEFNLEQIRAFKETELYSLLFDEYERDKEDALTEVMDQLFDDAEEKINDWMSSTLKTYKVRISETFVQYVDISAEDQDEAFEKAELLCNSGDIDVLKTGRMDSRDVEVIGNSEV